MVDQGAFTAREAAKEAMPLAPEANIHHDFALSRSPIGNKQRLIDSPHFSVRDTSAEPDWSSVFITDQLERPFKATLHTGSDVLLSLIRRGRMKANVQLGESGKVYSGGVGRIVIIPDNQSFDVELFTEIQTTHIYIKRSMLDAIAEADFGWNARYTRIVPHIGIVDSLLMEICNSIRSEMRVESQKSKPYVDKMLQAVAVHLLSRYSNIAVKENSFPSGSSISPMHFKYIEKLVKERLSGPITVDELASGTDLSLDHFIRLFKQQTNITPYQYVIRARVEYAGTLLDRTDMSLAQIAQQSGFADQAHFTRTFHRHFGEAPGTYRKKTRNTDPE